MQELKVLKKKIVSKEEYREAKQTNQPNKTKHIHTHTGEPGNGSAKDKNGPRYSAEKISQEPLSLATMLDTGGWGLVKRGGSPWAPGCTTRVPRRKGQAGHRWKQSHPPKVKVSSLVTASLISLLHSNAAICAKKLLPETYHGASHS